VFSHQSIASEKLLDSPLNPGNIEVIADLP
jgi:hypothetical protein